VEAASLVNRAPAPASPATPLATRQGIVQLYHPVPVRVSSLETLSWTSAGVDRLRDAALVCACRRCPAMPGGAQDGAAAHGSTRRS